MPYLYTEEQKQQWIKEDKIFPEEWQYAEAILTITVNGVKQLRTNGAKLRRQDVRPFYHIPKNIKMRHSFMVIGEKIYAFPKKKKNKLHRLKGAYGEVKFVRDNNDNFFVVKRSKHLDIARQEAIKTKQIAEDLGKKEMYLGEAERLSEKYSIIKHYMLMHYLGEAIAYPPPKFMPEQTYRLAMALVKWHEKGHVHQDLKTANILVDPVNNDFHLIDCGFADGIMKMRGTKDFLAPDKKATAKEDDLYAIMLVSTWNRDLAREYLHYSTFTWAADNFLESLKEENKKLYNFCPRDAKKIAMLLHELRSMIYPLKKEQAFEKSDINKNLFAKKIITFHSEVSFSSILSVLRLKAHKVYQVIHYLNNIKNTIIEEELKELKIKFIDELKEMVLSFFVSFDENKLHGSDEKIKADKVTWLELEDEISKMYMKYLYDISLLPIMMNVCVMMNLKINNEIFSSYSLNEMTSKLEKWQGLRLHMLAMHGYAKNYLTDAPEKQKAVQALEIMLADYFLFGAKKISLDVLQDKLKWIGEVLQKKRQVSFVASISHFYRSGGHCSLFHREKTNSFFLFKNINDALHNLLNSQVEMRLT